MHHTAPSYLIGLDLAQSSDYTALCIDEVSGDGRRERTHAVRHLERINGLSYLAIAAGVRDRVAALRTPVPLSAIPAAAGARVVQIDGRDHLVGSAGVAKPVPMTSVTVIFDATGVGAAVADVLYGAKIAATLVPVLIHGGDKVTHDGGVWRVPKRDLVSALVVAFQNGRVKIAKDLKLAPVLTAELQNFKLKLNPATMHDSYSAWRDAEHDDLVLAASLSVWWGSLPKPVARIW